MKTALAAASLLAIAMLPGAALAETVPPRSPLEMTTDPADRAVMAEVAALVAKRTPDLAQLDVVLAKLPRPTPLRGMVQTVRAGLLARARESGPAVTAIEEALRLLPDHPQPKLAAVSIFTFSGAPARAADLWLQASRQVPGAAQRTSSYLIDAMIGRLRDSGDHERADRVGARLSEIGYAVAKASDRSSSALARTRQAVRSGQQAEALQAVTAIGSPGHLMTLYVDRRYEALWPRIAEWAGADLADQTVRYLEELRSDWTATRDFRTAVPYARQLAGMDAHEQSLILFLPLFDGLSAGEQDRGGAAEAEFLAPVLSRALVRLDRGAEARDLLARVAAAMPSRDGGNSLNIDGAYLSAAAEMGDWPAVITLADAFLARADDLGSSINRGAIIQVTAWRACALSQLGRTDEAQAPIADVLLAQAMMPTHAMTVHLCRGDLPAARALVVERLADEQTRTWALGFVQPKAERALTPLDRLMQPAGDAVRNARDVITAAEAVGRILPEPVNATLPAGFDPLRANPAAELPDSGVA